MASNLVRVWQTIILYKVLITTDFIEGVLLDEASGLRRNTGRKDEPAVPMFNRVPTNGPLIAVIVNVGITPLASFLLLVPIYILHGERCD